MYRKLQKIEEKVARYLSWNFLHRIRTFKVGREKTHVGNIRKVETFQDIAYCTFLNSCHTNFREAKDFFTL